MEAYLITFRSVTFAQRGEHVLQKAGIRSTLQRAPRFMEERGCGYSLTVREDDVQSALAVLRRSQVPFRRLYVRRADGSMEETAV